jgi:predicted DNA-binding transcriptional regulator YafY
MRKGQLVTFTYKKTDQNKPEKEHTVAPVHIRMFEDRYYLYALLRGSDGTLKPKMTLFAIDQIRNYTVQHVPLDDYSFDHVALVKKVKLKSYFNHVIGVWHPEDQAPEIVKLRLTGVAKSYVKHRKLHPTQKIVHHGDTSVTVEIHVYVSHELDYLLGRFREMCVRV